MRMGRAFKVAPEISADPRPEPSGATAASGALPEREDAWEIVDAGDPETATEPLPPSDAELDRERLLVEAGRLYGRDTARERAALLDGSHPLHRLKHRAA